MRYINHTPWRLCLAPCGMVQTETLEPGKVIERGYVKDVIVEDTNTMMAITELEYSIDLPPPQEDVLHVVTLKAKLCRNLRDRRDVVAIGDAHQRNINDAVEVWSFIR